MSPNVKRMVLAISAASILALVGCGGGGGSGGGGATCSEACGHLFDCAGKLGVSGSQVADAFGNSSYDNYADCFAHCQTGDCPRQQQLLDCAVDVSCNSLSQVASDTASCFTAAQCEP